MAQNNFAACMAEIFAHEGGFVDHPRDPGGATNMGITIGTLRDWRGGQVTKEDVQNLTSREAQTIYRVRYWNPVKADQLPSGVDLVAFDSAVNSGVRRGVQWLQRAVRVEADGRMGPDTLQAANGGDTVVTIKRACAIRMGFLQGLRTWSTFGRGWSRRVARVEAVAVRMAVEALNTRARPMLLAGKEDAETKAQRDAAGAGGVAVTGGTGATLADLPTWGLAALAVVAVVIIINLLGKRRHDLDRAAAYQKAAEEASA